MFAGYGFVDFDSPAAAQKAVTALKSSGVQAQMAKVRLLSDHVYNQYSADMFAITSSEFILMCTAVHCVSCRLQAALGSAPV